MKKSIYIIFIIAVVYFIGSFLFYKTKEINANRHLDNNIKEAKRVYDTIPIWHKKIQTKQDLKIGIITDTHLRPSRIERSDESDDAPRYFKEKYAQPLKNFVLQMQEFQPDYIIHGGDIIEGTDDPDWLGIMGIEMAKEEFEKIGAPIYWTLGNHELRSITKQQFKETLGLSEVHQVIDTGDYRFVIVDGNFHPNGGPESGPTGNRYIPGFVSKDELDWLKEQLSTDKRTFVFLHQGVFPKGIRGEDGGFKGLIFNSQELIDVFKEYRVDGFFNGHIEARGYEELNGTEYFSLTGTKKSELYPESYYELTITGGDPNVIMFYSPINATEIKRVNFESCKDAISCGDSLLLSK